LEQGHSSTNHLPIARCQGLGARRACANNAGGRRGAGGERPGQWLPQPCPWTASTGSHLREPGRGLVSHLSPSLDSLHQVEGTRAAASCMGELAFSRGLAAASYLTYQKHRLTFLRIKTQVR